MTGGVSHERVEEIEWTRGKLENGCLTETTEKRKIGERRAERERDINPR